MMSEINLCDVKCDICGGHFCFRCHRESHFPAFCEEKNWWDNRYSVTDPDRKWWIYITEQELSDLEELMGIVRSKKSLTETGFFDANPIMTSQIRLAIQEMEKILNILRWVSVLLCSSPELEEELSHEISAVKNSIQNLLFLFPTRGDNMSGIFSTVKTEAAKHVLTLLQSLMRLRTSREVDVVEWEIYESASSSEITKEDADFASLRAAMAFWSQRL